MWLQYVFAHYMDSVYVWPTDLISLVKQKLMTMHDMSGLPPMRYWSLWFNGRELDNTMTVEQCGLQDEFEVDIKVCPDTPEPFWSRWLETLELPPDRLDTESDCD